MKDAFPITRRDMIRPATDTLRGSASSLNSAFMSVEKALVTYSAAGVWFNPHCSQLIQAVASDYFLFA